MENKKHSLVKKVNHAVNRQISMGEMEHAEMRRLTNM